jgi:hypothetical protein
MEANGKIVVKVGDKDIEVAAEFLKFEQLEKTI